NYNNILSLGNMLRAANHHLVHRKASIITGHITVLHIGREATGTIKDDVIRIAINQVAYHLGFIVWEIIEPVHICVGKSILDQSGDGPTLVDHIHSLVL